METECRTNLRERQLRPEWMDRPGLDVGLHRAALRGLERVNALCFVHRPFWSAIQQLAASHPSRELRMLDVACGGGDVAVRLSTAARRIGIRLHIDGCDISPTAIAVARERAERLKASCRFFEFDVLRDAFPTDYDLIGTSLFLHHLTTEAALGLLAQMAAATRHSVVVNDLVRSQSGYLLARYVSHLLSRSPIVHSDGPLSVAGAFTLKELRSMAERAGMKGAVVTRCWPARMLLHWNKS